MRNFPRMIFVLLFAGFLFNSGATEKNEFLKVQFQIFRIQGTLSGDTSLDEKIWKEEYMPNVDIKKAISFFTKGNFRLGENSLDISEKGWFWNEKPIFMDQSNRERGTQSDSSIVIRGKPKITVPDKNVILAGEEIQVNTQISSDTPLKLNMKDGEIKYKEKDSTPFSEEFQLIASPSVVVESGSNTTFRVSSNQDIEYFEKREDGLFELKRLQEPTGLIIEGAYKKEDDQKVRISDLRFKLDFVERREPIPGVLLQVGPPVLQKREYLSNISISQGKDFGILLHPGKGQGILIMRLRIDIIASKATVDI